jgi:hypothetical protein
MNIKKIKLIVGAAYGTVALMNLGLEAQTLTITNGLQLWLIADFGVTTNASAQVTAWADQSGLGNNATQATLSSAPTLALNSLNGHATLRVSGSQYMEVPNANGIDNLLDDVTILTVVNYDNLSGYRGVVSKCTGGVGSPFDFWSNASLNAGRTSLYLGNGSASTATISTIAPPTGVYNVMSFRWKLGISDQFLNDFNIGSAGNNAATANGATNLRIGRRQDNTVQLVGNLAELLIYKPALSDTDLYNVINNYLKIKYALVFDIAPNVSITSPTNNTTVAAGTAIPMSISTSDADGYVASVAVYGNGALIATGTAANTNSSSTFQLSVAATYPGVMALTAVAMDNAGHPSTSAPVLVNITGSAPTNPVPTGLSVWLKADAGVTTNASGGVTTWSDQSGNGNDAVQVNDANAPLFVTNAVNGNPVLRFNGIAPSVQYLEVSDTGTAFLTNDFTTFALARFVGSYPALRQNVWSKCSSAGWAGPIDWWFNTTTGVPFCYRGDGVNYLGFGGTTAPTLGLYSVLGLEVTGVDGGISHYLGFTGVGSGTALTNTADAGFPLRIGRREDNGTQLNGDIAEILLYNQALSGTDRTNVTAYLYAKYNVVQPFNATPPPAITITSPANGASVPAPTTVSLAATASSANGVITRVTLSANGTVFATLTNAPYQVPLDLLTPGTVTFTAVALDNWGVQTTATQVVVTVTGSASATPYTNGLRLQLAADLGVTTNASGAVTSWIDQSLNGNNAAPTNATTSPLLVPNVINAKPVLRYSGANQSLDVPPDNTGFTAGDLSSFALVKFSNYSTYRTVWTKVRNNISAPFDWYFAVTSGNATVLRGNGTTSFGSVVGTPPAAGAFAIVGCKISGTSVSQYIGYNNTANGTISGTPVDAGLPLRIGRRTDGVTQMMGDIAEILIYDHAVSDAERLQIVNYLNAKWGISVVQLANVPPTPKILTPTNGMSFVAPSTISVVASVTDPDSPISQVDFLVNGFLVASRTATPYQIPLQVLSPGPLAIQVRATDFWGAVSNSAPVVVTVTGSGPASPPTTGCALWLRADLGVTTNVDGSVATWADQSGNGNNAAQDLALGYPSPMLTNDVGGRPMLNFDGTIRYLVVPDAPSLELTNDMSLFCAASCANFSAVNMLCNKGYLTGPHPFNFYVNTAGQTVAARGDNRGTSTITSTSALPVTTNVVCGFTALGSTGTDYLQGLANGTGSFGYGDIDDATQLYIGSRDALDLYFNGNLGELLIYDHALSSSDLQLVNSYLAGKYGVATVQLSTQPPTLNVARTGASAVQLSWLAGYTGFILEGRTNVASGAWTPVATNPPNNQVTLGTTNVARFFRLRGQ